MAETQSNQRAGKDRELEHKVRVWVEAKLHLVHYEIALEAAEKGLLTLYHTHREEAEKHGTEVERLKGQKVK